VAALGTLSVLEQNEADQRDALADAVRDLTEESSDVATEVIAPEPDAVVSEPAAETPQETPATEGKGIESAPQTVTAEVEEPASGGTDAGAEVEGISATGEAEAAPPEPEVAEQKDAAPQPDAFEPVGTLSSGEPSEPAARPADVTGVTPDVGAPTLEAPEAGTDESPDSVTSLPTPAPETGDIVAALPQPETPNRPTVATPTQSIEGTPNAPLAQAPDAPDREAGLNIATEPAAPPAAPEPVPAPEPDGEAETASVDAQEKVAPARSVVRQLVPTTPAPDTSDGDIETAALARPAIGRPAGSLIDRNADTPSRLPTIGESSAPELAETEAAEQTQDTRPPLERFAADVGAVDPSLPRMAIVLLDDGTGPLGPETLDNFPFPVTFALDPGQPDPATRMAAYRARGYEVATLATLPPGAQPTDVEQILAGALAAVPESVALIEAPGGGLQSDRASTEQTAAFVAESGHGLVFLPNGLNTAEAIARRENVPAVSILRDFDGDGQDARTKRRFLDGAAFRARQDGSVVMLGRLTPDTVSALLLWSLQDRAASVTMVPVSAILSKTAE
jgi:polysaccharide deacetylase 2 family uncharacterized protein YibQ